MGVTDTVTNDKKYVLMDREWTGVDRPAGIGYVSIFRSVDPANNLSGCYRAFLDHHQRPVVFRRQTFNMPDDGLKNVLQNPAG